MVQYEGEITEVWQGPPTGIDHEVSGRFCGQDPLRPIHCNVQLERFQRGESDRGWCGGERRAGIEDMEAKCEGGEVDGIL